MYFWSLNDIAKRKVALKFYKELEEQLAEKSINVSIDENSIDFILDKGYDERMGARPMARAIDNPLRKSLLNNYWLTKPKTVVKLKLES